MNLSEMAFAGMLAALAATVFAALLVGRRGAQIVSGLGWVAALGSLACAVGLGDRVSLAGGALATGRLGALLDVAITLVGAIVLSFGARQLREDPRRRLFLVAASSVIAGMVLVTVGSSWFVLVVGWLMAGWGFVVAHGLRRDLPGVARSFRRAVIALAVGDLALVVAALLAAGGPGALFAAGMVGDGRSTLGPVAGLLIAVAVLSRAAQGPFAGWLPGTAASPSPTGALLHAGVVNGGAILLIRLRGAVPLPVLALVVVVGLGTSVVAGQLLLRRPDLKGQLVFSTMAQMGFLVAACAVGAYLAALVHLVGHAWYKSNLLLSASGRIERTLVGTGRSTWYPWLVGLGAGILWLVAPGADQGRGAVVLALLVGIAGGALAVSLSGLGRLHRLGAAMAILSAALVFGALVGMLGAWLGAITPRALVAPSPWWLLAVVPASLAAARLARLSRVDRALWRAALGLRAHTRDRQVASLTPEWSLEEAAA